MQVKVRGKGQMTLPKEIREEVGLEVGESLSVLVIDGEIRMRPVKGVVERTAGIFSEYANANRGRPIEQILAEEKEGIARGWVEGFLLEENRD